MFSLSTDSLIALMDFLMVAKKSERVVDESVFRPPDGHQHIIW